MMMTRSFNVLFFLQHVRVEKDQPSEILNKTEYWTGGDLIRLTGLLAVVLKSGFEGEKTMLNAKNKMQLTM